jgi:endonuclease/exonuclease/phosphatase (EEP) superfamily protein YafD
MTLRRVASFAFGAALAAVAALTALSFCGAWYYPADLFSHFRLHLAAAALILTICLLLAGPRRAALLVIALVAINLLAVAPVRTVPVAQARPGDLALTIVTFNIWGRNGGLKAVARMLEATAADIVLLQEVGPQADGLLAALASAYPWRHDCRRVKWCDVAILSRAPWVETGTVAPTSDQASFLWARFERGGKSFTVATTHLNRPPWPIHLRQIDSVARAVARLSGPVILAGDFNAAPWSHAIGRLIENSGLAPLAGLRPTWPAALGLAQLPIDHVLVSDGVRNLGAKRGPFAGSDHLPVIARLAIGAPTRR